METIRVRRQESNKPDRNLIVQNWDDQPHRGVEKGREPFCYFSDWHEDHNS